MATQGRRYRENTGGTILEYLSLQEFMKWMDVFMSKWTIKNI